MMLTRGFLLGAGAQALNLAGSIITRVLLWRLLGVQSYGGVAFGLNLVTVITRSLSPGLAPATQHMAAKPHLSREEVARMAALLGFGVAAVLALGTFAALPLLATYYFPVNSHVTPTFAWLAIGIFPVVITSILVSLLLAWGRFAEYNLVALITGMGVPVAMLATIVAFPPTSAVIIAHLFCWYAAAGLAYMYTAGPISAGRWNGAHLLPLLKFAIQSWPNTVLTVGAARLISIVGLAFVGDVQFGFYILAVNVTEALFAMFTPISQILFTHVSKSRDNSFDIVARSLRLATFTFSLICLGFILIGKPLILLVLGESAAPAWPISLIVLASAAAHAMMRAMNSVTAGMGKPLLSTVALGIEVAVIAACIVPLGVRYGTMGLAICGVIGSAAALLVTARQVCRLMQLKPIRLFVPTIGDIEFALARVGAQWGDRRKKPK